MLRLTVLLLLLANAAYFAWSQGLLALWGLAPAQQSEPQRLERQIKPQSLRILGGDEAGGALATAAVPAPRTQQCLQAGLFNASQMASLKQVLEPWPAGSWVLEPALEPAHWIVKLPAVDDSLRPRLEQLRPALNGKNLRPCR